MDHTADDDDDKLVVLYQFQFDIKNENNLAVDEDWLITTFTTMSGGDRWQLVLTRTDLNSKSDFNGKLLLNHSTSAWKLVRIGVVSECEGRQIRSATEEAIVFKSGREFTLGTFNIDEFSWQIRVEVLRYIEGIQKGTFEIPKSTLAADLLKWFQRDDFGDVTLLAADGKKFRCHRDILARRSEVFRQMLRIEAEKNDVNKGIGETSKTQLPTELLNIEDFDEEIVVQLLLFVYIDDCGEIRSIADRLYAAADHYKLDRLKNLCESALVASLSRRNVAKVQQLAEHYNVADLLAECVDYQALGDLMAAEEPNAKRARRARHTGPTAVSIASKILPIRIPPGSILIDEDQMIFEYPMWGRMPVGKVDTKIFTDGIGDRWELKLEKTGDNDVKRQLRLIETSTDTPKIVYLTCESWQNGDTDVLVNNDTTPMGLFIHRGDTVEFGPFPCWVDRLDVEVQLVISQECVAVPPKTEPPKSQMATEVLKWFEEDNFGDSTITTKDGKKFKCHRDILSARSEVFSKKIRSAVKNVISQTSESQKAAEISINIEDFEGEIVAQLLLFCYIDGCGQIGSIADRLYALADVYQLDRLKNLCESAMAANVSDKSVVDTYRLAKVFHLDKLMAECVEFVDDHRSQISSEDLLAGSVAIQE